MKFGVKVLDICDYDFHLLFSDILEGLYSTKNAACVFLLVFEYALSYAALAVPCCKHQQFMAISGNCIG